MKITFFSFYNISVSELKGNTGGTNYGNHLYYPINVLCEQLEKKGYKIVEQYEQYDIAIFLDLDKKLFDLACSLDQNIKKILVSIESPIYCPFVNHIRILFDETWNSVLTYNRSFVSDKLFYYDIPITGNIEKYEFQYPKKEARGVAVSSYKNDPRGYVPLKRDALLKQLAQRGEIDLYGGGWQKEKNIYGKTTNKLDAMKNHSFAVVIENSKYDGYVTEKLGDAILSGLPSIYYGDYKHAQKRFPGTFVILEELTLESFFEAKKELFSKYEILIKNVEQSFLNSEFWMDSFLESVHKTLDNIAKL